MMTNDDDEQNKQYNGLWNLQPTPRTTMEIIIKIKKNSRFHWPVCIYMLAILDDKSVILIFHFRFSSFFRFVSFSFFIFFSLSLFQFLFSFKLFWFDSTIFLFFLFLTCFLPNSRIRIDKMVKKRTHKHCRFRI